MSFTPLPKIFTDCCAGLVSPSSRIMELGCGDGRFGAVLADLGVSCWGLDRVPPSLGTTADLVGDAAQPPLAGKSLDLLIIPNLLRHMLPSFSSLSFMGRWLDLLKPGGCLFIFEDAPGGKSAGEANYRRLQDLLARLMPESRGPLLRLDEFKAASSGFLERADWEYGRERNRQAIAAAPVLDMLGTAFEPGGEVARLVAGITADGLDPGFYWWARAMIPGKGTGN